MGEHDGASEGPRIQLPDGRYIAYTVRGDRACPNVIVWLHGICSSRYECMSTGETLLRDLNSYIISFDRPGYGRSTAHRGRTFKSYVQDVTFALGHLGVDTFYVVGVSGGGPYALACAAFKPDMVKGVMLISAAGSPRSTSIETVPASGFLTPEEKMQGQHRQLSASRRGLLKLLTSRTGVQILRQISETPCGSRLLYDHVVKGLTENSLNAMAPVDRQCLEHDHPEYLTLVRPESQRQRSAIGFAQDLALYFSPWSFDPAALPSSLQQNIHIWHGTGDLQVPTVQSQAYKRMMPDAHLTIVEGGGHFAYYVGDAERQRQALSALLGHSSKL